MVHQGISVEQFTVQYSMGELGLDRKKIHIKLKFCTELGEGVRKHILKIPTCSTLASPHIEHNS